MQRISEGESPFSEFLATSVRPREPHAVVLSTWLGRPVRRFLTATSSGGANGDKTDSGGAISSESRGEGLLVGGQDDLAQRVGIART